MRLKYQLRGLGVGIILTAALLMIFSDDGEAAVKADTATVMTEETVETETTTVVTEEAVVETEEPTVEESVVEVETAEETSVVESVEESVPETTEEVTVEVSEVEMSSVEESLSEETSTEENATEESTVEETEAAIDNAEVVKIKIISGDDSGTVARKLQTAGVVENASEFDAFLMQHGYDKRISVGEVEIAKGSTWLEIAEKISGRN